MKTLAVANAAGSAGKTTTAVTLAALAATAGHRVLLVDLDGQATATWWAGAAPTETTVGDVLLRRAAVADAVVASPIPGLSVLPAVRSLDGDVLQLTTVTGREQRLRLALRDLDVDIVIIDCPGQIGTATVSAIVAADYVLAVTQPTMKELLGLPELEAVITDVQDSFGSAVALVGIVPCNVPAATAGRVYAEALALLADTYGDLVTDPVPRSVRVPEAHAQRRPLPLHAPSEPVTAAYRAVYSWLCQRGAL